LNIVEAFVDIFKKIFKDETKMNEIQKYLDELLSDNRQENKKLDYFMYCYFEFMSELYASDGYFFNYTE
jgi:uncharacterized membrane protein (DUF106 family)